MRGISRVLFVAAVTFAVACKGGSSSDGGVDSSSSSTGEPPSETAVSNSGNQVPIECDPGQEFFFEDGVGLGAVSVDAVRATDEDGVIQYDVYIHGDDTDVSQITIGFTGMPVQDIVYPASQLREPAKAFITLYPAVADAPTLQSGTVTFTQIGVSNGELLELELHLQLSTGTLDGCITVPLATTDGG